MMQLIDAVRDGIRACVRWLAPILNNATHGRISPNAITIFGLLAHVPIAFLIATGDYNILAAVLLVIFGLFDTLDGEIARLQKRESARGMLLDSATDRIKEALLYMGVAYYFTTIGGSAVLSATTVAALGGSMLTSYLNAMGDAIMAKHKTRQHASNKAFRGGLLSFEIRMTVLMLGLLTGQLEVAVAAIAILAGYTSLQRLALISRALA
jgi:CDP-diacylglycerol--glycerol-3-phosphate 3-phosphatidyltransferase